MSAKGRWLSVVIAAVLAGGGAGVGIHLAGNAASTAQTGTGWAKTSSGVNLYHVPERPAPGFSLTDQNGKPFTLASLRGKPVALYFMDPRCTDVCPIVAREFEAADRDLGAAAAHVALVGIDVNPRFLGRRWLDKFDAQHGLNKLSNWHFVTGTLAQLKRVWQDYSISIQVSPKTGEVSHTTVIDFIGPGGKLRAMAGPYALAHHGVAYLPGGLLGRWGTSIAGQLRQLLPGTTAGGNRL